MRRAIPALLLASLATACGGSDATGPVPVSQVVLNRTTAQLAVGDSVLLTATMRDEDGNTLTDRAVSWNSTNGSVASVSTSGWVKALQGGNATIIATSENISAQANITVTSTPVLTAITPALLTPGVIATITGTGFGPGVANNTVRIAGATATVTAASPTQLTVTVPSQAQLPCKATHNASVAVTVSGVTGSLTHPLQSATQRSLNVGESLSFASAAEARCNEFAQTGGRYFVTVQRSDNTLNLTSSFRVSGEAATVASPKVVPAVELPAPTLARRSGAGILSPFLMVEEVQHQERARQHRQVLEENRTLLGGRLDLFRRRASSSGAPSLSRSRVSFARGTVGDTTEIKIPNRNLPAGTSTCTSAPIKVRARTVYSGSRAIILEDVASPTAGMIDSHYQALGQEFDNVMYPIVTANFGDPLAYDDFTDGNGKLLMLFSKQINDFGGILGFVTTCDFIDTLANPTFVASNQAEIFYAIAPTTTATGFDGNSATYTRDEWRRIIRATLIHEAKHLAMFAERLADPNAITFETSWLEEGMAMVSEEFYSRTVTGAAWKGNTEYGSAGSPNHIWCELRPTNASCADRPFVMTSHFGFLYEYLSDIENKTIVGGVATGDGSFYGSSWAFIRWMLDAYIANEPAVLRALTTEGTLTGAANLEARSGVPFSTMLPQFHYALQYDDVAGITPAAPWQHIQSWNIRNIYAGLNTDLPTLFQADFLNDHPVQFGNFAFNVNAMRGGTAVHLELSGPQAGKQSIALTAQNGGAPDPLLRMTVFRVQ